MYILMLFFFISLYASENKKQRELPLSEDNQLNQNTEKWRRFCKQQEKEKKKKLMQYTNSHTQHHDNK